VRILDLNLNDAEAVTKEIATAGGSASAHSCDVSDQKASHLHIRSPRQAKQNRHSCHIRVNCVNPGVIDTPFREVFSTPESMRNFAKMIPLGRVGSAMECAKVIVFLASDAASYIGGESIEVNGGQLML
jgi:hypothetical protein